MCDTAEKKADTVTCCPRCGEEALEVKITSGGSGHDEWGVVYWFGGDAHCTACGYSGYHSDSSH